MHGEEIFELLEEGLLELEQELEEVDALEVGGLTRRDDGVYFFSNFEALQQLAGSALTEHTFACYEKDSGELVIREDITIPANLTVIVGGSFTSVRQYGIINWYGGVETWDGTVRVENGAHLKLNGNLEAQKLIIDGDMTIGSSAHLVGFYDYALSIEVYGSITNQGIISAGQIEGLQFISQSTFSGWITINMTASSVDDLTDKLFFAEENRKLNTTYQISLQRSSSEVVIDESVTIPSNAVLTLRGNITLAAACRMQIYGELNLTASDGVTEFNVYGELSNRGRIEFSSGTIRLLIKEGGKYTGPGKIYLSSGQASASACMPGFDLSRFSQSKNGTYTVYTPEDYEEPWANGEFSSFEELKEWAEAGSEVQLKKYTGPNPLVIEEDLTLGTNQNFHIYPTDIVVPEGVTFTVMAPMSCHGLTVQGTMHAYSWVTTGIDSPDEYALNNPNFVDVTGRLYVHMTLETSQLSGEENILLLDDDIYGWGQRSMIFLTIYVTNEEQLQKVLYQAQYDISDRKEYCPAFYRDFTLTRDLAVPVGCSLDLYKGLFTIAEGARLTISGGMELRGGSVLANGMLENDNQIEIFQNGITLKNSSCYAGAGLINVYTGDTASALKGFDLANMYVSDSGRIVTNSEAEYKAIIERQEKTKTIVSAEATMQFCQTEARTQLQYVNNFRKEQNASGPLQYSYALEEIAMQRAAEIAIDFDGEHLRPSGGDFNTLMASDGTRSSGENIAAGSTMDTAYEAFEGWRESSGHRRNMLSGWGTIGIGCVKYDGIYFWVQEFGGSPHAETATAADDSTRSVSVDIVNYNIKDYQNIVPDPADLRLKPGDSAVLPTVTAGARVYDSFAILTEPPIVRTAVAWTSSDPSVAAIVDGNIVALREGKALLTGKAFEQDVSVSVLVEASTTARLPGDVNRDGAVNGLDIVRFRRFLAGESVFIDRSNGDINNDGKTNARDLRTIRRYLAGADVSLK